VGGINLVEGDVENTIVEGDLVANGEATFYLPSISQNEFYFGLYDFDEHIRLMERDVHILAIYQSEIQVGRTYHYKVTLTGNNRIRCYVDYVLLIDYTYALDTFNTPPWSDDFNDLAYTLSHTRHWYVGYVNVENGVLTLLPKPAPHDNAIRCMRYSIRPSQRDKWKDYIVETTFMLIDAPIEIPFRIFDDEHREKLYIAQDIWDEPPAREVSVWQYYGTERIKLGEGEFSLYRNIWYDLRLEVRGETFTVYINNQLVMECEDSNPRLLTTGTVGVGVVPNCQAKFDSFTVTPLDQWTPPPTLEYPSNNWYRLWYEYSDSLADPWGVLLGHDSSLDESNLDFDSGWGVGEVAYGRSDFVCFKAGRTISISSDGLYTFTIGGDDGVRLYVDDELVVDGWVLQGYTQFSDSVLLMSGDHTFRLEWCERTGYSRVSFGMIPN